MTAAEILRKHTPYEALQFKTWVEQGILAAMKEIAEISYDKGFGESYEGFNAEFPNPCHPLAKEIDKERYADSKKEALSQLFTEQETQKP